jgi:hypothetical protein
MAAQQIGRFVIDPTLTTLSTLTRISEPEWEAIAAWIAEQRKTRQERAEESEREARESAKALLRDVKTRHAGQEAWAAKNA